MPHAVDQEDDLFDRVLAEDQIDGLDNIHNRDLEVGEKAKDAEDFGDIGDDDLADEEEAESVTPEIKGEAEDDSGLFEADGGDDDPFDDLFNAQESNISPTLEVNDPVEARLIRPTTESGDRHSFERVRDQSSSSTAAEDILFTEARALQQSTNYPAFRDINYDDEDSETREQRLLFEQARKGREERMQLADSLADLPPPPQTDAELFSIIWPQFEADVPPRFGQLLPYKRAFYLDKTPAKPPKPVQPTKVSLEVQQDQEKSFKLPGLPPSNFLIRQAEAAEKGVVLLADTEPAQEGSDDDADLETLEDTESVGGIKWQDLVVLCEDWDIPSGDSSSDDDATAAKGDLTGRDVFGENEVDMEADARPTKKHKTTHSRAEPLSVLHNVNSLIDNPEEAMLKLAKKVYLDMNDPHMLIDIQPPTLFVGGRKRKVGGDFNRDTTGGLTRDLSRRYNISNDEAYDMLKENHQSKIRSTLGNLTVEHALPALRLQYPFYKVKLSSREARSFHRPTFTVSPGQVSFAKTHFVKRKNHKGKDPHTLFEKSKDLSLGDNSNILLLEYSEEYPTMMSSFGMGSRLINYYRRKDNLDTFRPKLDIGEATILLPQDKSPFSIFGGVDPGQTMPTFHNGMYRAPVFKHNANQQDFIVVRNRTSVEGPVWYLRNVENLHVVGQEFPSVEVPGAHSRKVTDAAKRRLKMLSYRMFKKYKKVDNEMIRDHLLGSEIAQNRSKMREFMDYDKEKGWLPRKLDYVSEESVLRSMIKPEDVCLLESMQVGDRQLQDAGYNKDEDDVEREEDDEKSGQSLDQQLAPWHTTKNFLNACQSKAMLQLHGEGDPSGRGEALNFMRTSMKGGFKEIGESVEDRLDAKKLKELGGHSYNVARQQKSYHDSIRRIWEAQQRSLSSTVAHDDVDMEDDGDETGTPAFDRGRTPSSAFGRSRRDNETGSVFSKGSTTSQSGKVCKITRHVRDKYGKEETQEEIIRDPRIIRQYIKRRKEAELASLSLGEMKYTGDEERDKASMKHLAGELARLERNKERRLARNKAKGITEASSPNDAASPAGEGETSTSSRKNAGATQRKCANCGQVGHIKTNKKLCSLCIYMSTPISQLC